MSVLSRALLVSMLVVTFMLAASHSAHADIILRDAYSYPTLSGTTTGAAYVTIENTAQKPLAITSASTEIANSVELHTHITNPDNGVVQMKKLDKVIIPAGGVVTFAPGGKHLMLLGVTRSLSPGDTVDMTLTLEDGRTLPVNVTVRKRPTQ